MSRADPLRIADYLQPILEAIGNIQDYTAGMDLGAFMADRKSRDAVIRNLEVIGEASGAQWLQKKLQERHRARGLSVRAVPEIHQPAADRHQRLQETGGRAAIEVAMFFVAYYVHSAGSRGQPGIFNVPVLPNLP
jgi:hypothetical protein